MPNPRLVHLNISKFSKKGNGLAPLLRPKTSTTQWAEVPFTMPGDEVLAHLLSKRRGLYHATLQEVVQPSPERISPRCTHFGTCGGCRFQHLSYDHQLRHKAAQIQHWFASLIPSTAQIFPILPSPDPWHYRNKMEYSFFSGNIDKHALGLIIDSSKGRAFNLIECPLTSSWFVDTLKGVRHWWENSDLKAYHTFKNTGSLRNLTLREGFYTGDRMAILTVSGNPDYALRQQEIDAFVATVQQTATPSMPDSHLSIFLRIQQIAKGHPTNWFEMHLAGPDHIKEQMHIQSQLDSAPQSLLFQISPSAFFQPNTQQAERLYSRALQMAAVSPETVVYDLYCGTGTLGISLSKHVKHVIGIELSPEAVLDGKVNLKLNGCDNVTLFAGAVDKVLQKETDLPKPDLIIVDPPRSGLDQKALNQILVLSPKKLLYISCNPETQALNAAELMRHGYQISAMQAVDQFPQTYHIENIVYFEKRSDFS